MTAQSPFLARDLGRAPTSWGPDWMMRMVWMMWGADKVLAKGTYGLVRGGETTLFSRLGTKFFRSSFSSPASWQLG